MKPKQQQADSNNTSMSTTNPAKSDDGGVSKRILLKRTGAKVFKSPDRGPGRQMSDEAYNALCHDLIEGKTIVAACVDHKLAKSTVQAIRESIRDEIPSWKERTSAKLGELITDLADSLAKDLRDGRLSPDRKSISLGILADKKFALDGENGVTITHKRAETDESWQERFKTYLDSLPQANPEVGQLIHDQQDPPPKPLVVNDNKPDCTETVREIELGGGGD
jgi:hypothetical protein|tara:strand:- start:10978 stop:11643 length:666 start_codon:yes stop_codon:yes gene_type:complete